jgi:glucose-1-phosphate thymidylyltransferase
MPAVTTFADEPVGVIPGGGTATRLAPLPCSKELLPIGFRATPNGPRPKVVASYLIDSFTEAGVREVFWLLDRAKTDVMSYFGSGEAFGTRLAYVAVDGSPSVVHTVDGARAFLRERPVLFGFPDIIFEPAALARRVWERLRGGGADVVLGAVPAPPEQIADRVRVGPAGRVLEVRVKPLDSPWPDAWILAAWAPGFTRFLQAWLAEQQVKSAREGLLPAELYMGHAVQAAIGAGMSVLVETLHDGSFIDAGTPAGLANALRRYGSTSVDVDPRAARP